MSIKAYKGFNHDMTCRDFQYEKGKTYKTDYAQVYCSGFHACIMPADVFKYYGFAEFGFDSKFYEVELDGQIDAAANDSKIASTEITIKTEMTVSDLLRAQSEVIMHEYYDDNASGYLFDDSFFKVVTSPEDKFIASNGNDSIAALCHSYSSIVTCGDKSISSIIGHCSMSLTDGECSIASNIGKYSISIASGVYSIATGAGDDSKTMTTGICSISASTSQRALTRTSGIRSIAAVTCRGSEATSTGKKGVAINTSPYSGKAITTGDEGVAVSLATIDGLAKSTGNKSIAIGTGIHALVNVSGEGSVAIVKGINSRGSGSLGSYIIFIYDENGKTKTKMIHITGKKYKPNIVYGLDQDHKVVEWDRYVLSYQQILGEV